MGIVYIILWALIAGYCFFMAHRISPILYILGGFFVFMFGWYLADYILAFSLFAGLFGIIFRIIAAAFLIFLLIIYFNSKKRNSK